MLIFQYIRQLMITVKFIDNKQWTKNFSIDYIYSVKIWLELSSMCASRYSYPKPYFSSVCVYVCLFVNEFCCRFWAKRHLVLTDYMENHLEKPRSVSLTTLHHCQEEHQVSHSGYLQLSMSEMPFISSLFLPFHVTIDLSLGGSMM